MGFQVCDRCPGRGSALEVFQQKPSNSRRRRRPRLSAAFPVPVDDVGRGRRRVAVSCPATDPRSARRLVRPAAQLLGIDFLLAGTRAGVSAVNQASNIRFDPRGQARSEGHCEWSPPRSGTKSTRRRAPSSTTSHARRPGMPRAERAVHHVTQHTNSARDRDTLRRASMRSRSRTRCLLRHVRRRRRLDVP